MKHFSEDDLKKHKQQKRRRHYPAIVISIIVAALAYAQITFGIFDIFRPTKEVYFGQIGIMCPASWEQEEKNDVYYISDQPLNEPGTASAGVYEMKSLKGITNPEDLKFYYQQSLDALFTQNGYKPQEDIYVQNEADYTKVVRKYHVLSDSGALRVVYGNILVSKQSAYAVIVSGMAENANRVLVPLEDSIKLDPSKPQEIKFSSELPVRSA